MNYPSEGCSVADMKFGALRGSLASNPIQHPIPGAVSELASAIKGAHEVASHLESRLGKVLENHPPEASNGAPRTERAPACELHAELLNQVTFVNDLTSRLQSLIGRLAL